MSIEDYIKIGREWVKKNIFPQDLYHYGVKGMRWGVRNGLRRTSKNSVRAIRVARKNKLVEEEIRSGKISRTINKDKQKRHTQDEHIPGRSYLYGDTKFAQKLVNELSGTGKLLKTKSGWIHKERVTSAYDIGVYTDIEGKQTPTRNAMIVYSNTGTHIYPVRKETK